MDIGKISLSVTLDEMKNINGLLARDEAKAIVRVTSSYGDEYHYDKCPTCDAVVLDGDVFCRKCGQRLDMENIAF